MTNKFFLLSLLFASLYLTGYAQIRVQGVTNDASNHIVKYVSIGIKDKGVGTVSNEQGVFFLVIPDSLKNEYLTFNHVGYNTIQLLPEVVNKNSVIKLEEKITELSEIAVIPKKTTPKWLKKGFKIPGYAYAKDLGEEWGIHLKIKKQSIVKQVKFEIKTCAYDSVKIRINMYKFKSDRQEVGEYLLSEPLYKTVEKSAKSKNYIVDIPEVITINQEDILLSFEFVHYSGEGHIYLPVYKGSGYVRETAMAKLEKTPFNSGLSLLIAVTK
ncbi:hypothetical protein FACS1894176_10240 [Bacteroidia bacterium]|nr:hypothetical protein FACS1894176_10240 [Bacteroidia bacterium]